MLTTGLATHQTGSITGDDLGSTGFEVPNYDSQEEIITEFIAPFLLIFFILHIGMQKTLLFVMDVDNYQNPFRPTSDNKERKKVKKYSITLSLLITGMIVPTALFRYLGLYVAIIFGSMIYLLGAVALTYFIYRLVTSFW